MRRISVVLVPVLVTGGLLAPASPSSAAPPTCHGLTATIVGTPDGDRLRGTPGPDVIVGLGGDDDISAREGDDVVCGGAGLDFIDGDRGDDRVYGGRDRDTLQSLQGSDELRGGTGDDDLLSSSEQPVRLYGGAGFDSLRGNLTEEPGYVFDAGGDLDEVFLTALSSESLVEVRRGPGTISSDGVVTGSYREIEFLAVEGPSRFSYFGTGERDFVTAMKTGQPFRAETFGGSDYVDSRPTHADDYIDAGAGDDVVRAGDGHDTCLHAEKAKGCEVVGP